MQNNRPNPSFPLASTKTLGIVALALLAAIYCLCFLSYPLIEGASDSRGSFVISVLLLPDALVSSWFGDGRLPTGMLDRGPILIGAGLWLAIAGWIGSAIFVVTDRKVDLNRGEHGALAILLGLSLLSSVTLVVGLAGQLASRWPLLSCVSVMLAAATIVHRRNKTVNARGQRDEVKPERKRKASASLPGQTLATRWASKLTIVLVIALATEYVMGSLMPPWEFDVVEYHLQAPKEFQQQGAIAFLPHNIYANMPLGAEMHALAAMTIIGGDDAWWLGGLVGKAVIGFHSLLAAWLLGSHVAGRFGQWQGWLAAGLLLACPGNGQVAMAGLIDSALGAYILAAAMVLKEWSSGRLLLASILAGSAAACKYPGLIYAVVPLVALVLLQAIRLRQYKQSLAWFAAMIVGLSITCGFWYAKNAVLAGNPVYPLASNLMGGKTLTEAKASQWANAHRVPVDSFTESGSNSAYSLRSLMASVEQVLLRSLNMNPIVPIFMVAAIPVCFRGRNLEFVWLCLAMWILAVWWVATHRIDRFWLPILPLCVGVAAVGSNWLYTKLSSGALVAFALCGMLYGAIMVGSPVLGDNRFFVGLHALRGDSGIPGEVPGRISPAVGWINQHLDSSKTMLGLIGEARLFDFSCRTVYSTCFDTNPIEVLLRGQPPEAQLARLRQSGLTHLMVNWTEINRYRSPGNYGFSEWPQQGDIQQMVDSQVLQPVSWNVPETSVQLFRVTP